VDRELLREQLSKIIRDFIESQGLILVDIILRYEGRDLFLRILADWPQGGISLGECASLNNRLGLILDEKGLIESKYVLEVSSPGLDRPLISKDDFLCCRAKEVRFFLRKPLNGKWELSGKIIEVTTETVKIDSQGSIIEIPMESISKAKQQF